MTKLLTKTANAATIIAVKETPIDPDWEIILCIRTLTTEYVTWIMKSSNKTCFSGNYFQDFNEAAQDFAERR